MRLDRGWIVAHIPHQGRMCLVDEVLEWSARSVRTRTAAHRSPACPLRSRGQLGAACGVEFAAQSMAIHGALKLRDSTAVPRPGRIVSVRGAELLVPRLDVIADDLIIDCVAIAADAASVQYSFSVHAAACLLLRGRVTIALDPPQPAVPGHRPLG